MADPNIIALNARLIDMINTGYDSDTGEKVSEPGRQYVSSLYPNEFEFYACAFELIDGDGNTEDFFSFPIMPKSYSSTRRTNTNIEKTMSGIVINANPTFVPFDISISGTFGRSFKRINIETPDSFETNTTKRINQKPVTVSRVFSSEYKTGYACYKILERIILKAQKQDNNYNPYKLYFYNLSLNYNFLVEPLTITPSQNRENSNMIWEYSLQLRAVAPAINTNPNYKTSLKLLTNYAALTQQAVFSSIEIDDYKKQRERIDKKKSKVQKIVERQTQGRAFGLLNNGQKSAVQALIELTNNPADLGDFSINAGEGILNKF